MSSDLLYQKVSRSIAKVLPMILGGSTITFEEVGSGRIYYATKNKMLIKILTEAVFVNSRKRLLTNNQINALSDFKRPLTFDIITFSLFNIVENKFRILEYNRLYDSSAIDIINMLIDSKYPSKLSTISGLKKLKSVFEESKNV